MATAKVTPVTLQQMKEEGEKSTLIPVYDYQFAKILDECGIDAFLIGDSLGTVIMGRKDDFSVTMEEMIHHTKAVAKAAARALVVADMPFMSYQTNIDEAKRNAGRLIKEGNADAVKLEGGLEVADTIKAIVDAGIPVMAHIGIIGQSLKLTGVYKVKGKSQEEREKLLKDAKAVEEAGAFMVGLEGITEDTAREISEMLKIPTTGIGAGRYCDGGSLNIYDIIGLTVGFKPKFVKRYANVRDIITDAVKQFINEVEEGVYPDEEHTYH
ncbi:3-methyl-2-oxobutanoate hydroxymethyltransferase [Chloroflexota bacterium]